MILTDLAHLYRYKEISPELRIAIDWLEGYDASCFVKGSEIIGATEHGEITVKSQEPALVPREAAALEAHKRFIDIQVPLKGTEDMGWVPVDRLKHPRDEYNEVKDVAFYGDSAQCILHVKVGQCAIFFPEDAHAPNIGLGNHRKLVIKVPVR